MFDGPKRDRPEWRAWRDMKARCYRAKHPCFHHYGGRGIKVCDRWLGPDGSTNFMLDMGVRPEGMSLDRINNDGDYTPENCRWATWKTQRRNTRRNVMITHEGRTQTHSDWSEELGVDWCTLSYRIQTLGVEAAFKINGDRRYVTRTL